ncbi:MAG: YdcF family protein [Alphaproteobacteria bacterium]|nr:YdcF family protein [Alphaproteobacteria bacterium]
MFALSKIVGWLVSPGNILLVMLVGGLMARRWVWGRVVASAAVFGFLLVAVLPIGPWALSRLEERFPAGATPEQVDGIVVLGGGAQLGLTEARGQLAYNEAVERDLALAQLALRHPRARMVFSGGVGELAPRGLTEADQARQLLQSLGIDPARVSFDPIARNTWENALNAKALAGVREGETWLLVTSAWHMPRAIGCFRRAGFEVRPYPVDFRTAGGFAWGLRFGLSNGLRSLEVAAHEWAGLVAYRWLGRTSALFPAP